MKNIISVLVIGKSGTGKSEFILSLIDEEQRKMIHASGEGQTTRASMEYNIDYSGEIGDLEFQVYLKNKKEFVEERWQTVERYFSLSENKIEYFKDNANEIVQIYYEDLMEKMICDDAFFNCAEFGEDVEKEIKELFAERFNETFWRDAPSDLFATKEEADSEQKQQNINEFERKWNEFWSEVYDCCKCSIPNTKQSFTLKPTESNKDDIELYLKVSETGRSYSSLVKTIKIFAKGTTEYQDIMERNKIDKVVLIDTYGLDHAEQMGGQLLEQRYRKLLREDYPEIKSVFYLRNIAAPGSPSDLELGISTLFQVEPSVIPYVVFTFLDKVFDASNPQKFKTTKAYHAVEKTITSICKTLIIRGVSSSLIKKRTDELLKTRIGYASKIEGGENTALCEINRESIETIFSSIRFEKYLGTAYVPMKLMKLEKMGNVLSVEELFKSRKLSGYPNATKGAIRKRIEPSKGRILGFNSSTQASVLWSDIIEDDLNERFKNVVRTYNWRAYLEPEVGELYDEVFRAIEEMFLKFSKKLYAGATNCVESFDLSKYGDLVIKSLYEDRENIISCGTYGTVGEYLTNIYDFAKVSPETKNKIQKIINEAYVSFFMSECRAHNARKIAEKITGDMSYLEKEELISDYYSSCEDDMKEWEMLEFEKMISDNITV